MSTETVMVICFVVLVACGAGLAWCVTELGQRSADRDWVCTDPGCPCSRSRARATSGEER